MYCKHCGKEIDEDSAFCSHCGKQISGIGNNINESDNQQTQVIDNSSSLSAQQIEENTEERKMYSKISGSTSKKYLLGCVVILLVFIVWGLYSLLGSKRIADITIDRVSEDLAIATQRYDRLYSFHEGLARVEKGKKFGYIDKLGKEIIPCIYDDANDFYNGLAVVMIGEKKGVINQHDEFVIPCIYEYLNIFKDNTIEARLNDKEGLINYSGKTIIPFEYEECGNFSEGLAPVRKGGLYGFVDNNNKLVIPCKYEELFDGIGFVEGLVGVKFEGNWGYIDKTGKIAIPFQEGTTGVPFSDGLSPFIRWTVIDNNIDNSPFSHLSMNRTWEMAYIDKSGRFVSEFRQWNCRGFRDGYAYVQDNNTHYCGLINSKGEFVIPFGEYSIIGVNCDGLIRVGRNNLGGFFNLKTKKEVIPCLYDDMPFETSEGLVSAKKDGKGGYVSISNEVIIPFIYDDAYNFSEGFGVVKRYGKYGYVDRYGNDTFSIK